MEAELRDIFSKELWLHQGGNMDRICPNSCKQLFFLLSSYTVQILLLLPALAVASAWHVVFAQPALLMSTHWPWPKKHGSSPCEWTFPIFTGIELELLDLNCFFCSADVKCSKNHRVAWLGRDLKDHQVPTPYEDPYEVLTSYDLHHHIFAGPILTNSSC